jgi:hypothetical protein
MVDQPSTGSQVPGASGGANQWRDLRDWLKLVAHHDQLLSIDVEVDPDEELAAIAFMGCQRPNAPAFLFNNLKDNRTEARILTNMLAASKERYALTVGLDPMLSTTDMISATRGILKRRIAPIHVLKETAPVNEIVLRDGEFQSSGRVTVDDSSEPERSRSLVRRPTTASMSALIVMRCILPIGSD